MIFAWKSRRRKQSLNFVAHFINLSNTTMSTPYTEVPSEAPYITLWLSIVWDSPSKRQEMGPGYRINFICTTMSTLNISYQSKTKMHIFCRASKNAMQLVLSAGLVSRYGTFHLPKLVRHTGFDYSEATCFQNPTQEYTISYAYPPCLFNICFLHRYHGNSHYYTAFKRWRTVTKL